MFCSCRSQSLIYFSCLVFSARQEHLKKLQEAYIHNAEDKMMQLEMVEQEDGTTGVRVLHGDAVIKPTTMELMSYIHDAEKYGEIQKLQTDCLQQAEEKVSIARQAYEMIDGTIQRIDKDLEAMEQLLQVCSPFDYYTSGIVRFSFLTMTHCSPFTGDGRISHNGKCHGQTRRLGSLPGDTECRMDFSQGDQL